MLRFNYIVTEHISTLSYYFNLLVSDEINIPHKKIHNCKIPGSLSIATNGFALSIGLNNTKKINSFPGNHQENYIGNTNGNLNTDNASLAVNSINITKLLQETKRPTIFMTTLIALFIPTEESPWLISLLQII